MSKRLEQVVRPFQQGLVFTARTLPPPPNQAGPSLGFDPSYPAEDIVQEWGGTIQLLYKAIGVKNLYGGAELTEVSRQTTTVRVENPDDPTQFVDVERIQKLHMRDENGADHFLTLNN